jgi:hypothetical protein
VSTAQWILNIALLVWVLTRNLGTRRVSAGTFLVPALVVMVAAAIFLRGLSTAGNDLDLELLGALVGLALGAFAALLTKVSRSSDGRIVVTAGVGFAALWILVIGGRVAFAEWATHGGSRMIGEFSMRHMISGAGAWTSAFVLLALAMVIGRLALTGLAVGRGSYRARVLPSGGVA